MVKGVKSEKNIIRKIGDFETKAIPKGEKLKVHGLTKYVLVALLLK